MHQGQKTRSPSPPPPPHSNTPSHAFNDPSCKLCIPYPLLAELKEAVAGGTQAVTVGGVHSSFSDTAPVYLSDPLRVYSPSRQLRSSSDSRTLRIPHKKTKTFGHCPFSHAAPSTWNSLPHEIRHIQSTTAFRTALKTRQFKSYHY